jgi:hypothetical protein
VIVTFDKREFEAAHALVKEWEERSRAVRGQFLYRATSKVYYDILGILPADRDDLRRSLKLQRIRLPAVYNGYSIRSDAPGTVLTEDQATSSVIYVAPKPHIMRSVPKETRILADFSPWTLETLPYPPDRKTADTISRRVSRREVDRVRRMRLKDRPAWMRQIKEAGLKPAGAPFQPAPKPVRAMPDVAFESLRLEFGLGGSPSRPHWRKSITKLALRGGAGMIARRSEFVRAMTSLSFRGWESWPRKPADGTIPVSVARGYVPFQKRLGLRVGQA